MVDRKVINLSYDDNRTDEEGNDLVKSLRLSVISTDTINFELSIK